MRMYINGKNTTTWFHGQGKKLDGDRQHGPYANIVVTM
jgi:hypothetical protein